MWAWDQRWRKEDKWFGSYSKWLKWQVMWLIWKFLLLWVIFVVAKMNSKNATLYVKSYSRQIQSSNNMLKCSTLGEVWNQIFVTSAKYQNQCIVKNLQYSYFNIFGTRKTTKSILQQKVPNMESKENSYYRKHWRINGTNFVL